MTTARMVAVTQRHGALPVRLSVPRSGRGPAIVLVPEIFGFDALVTDTADRLARLGYVVLCPDLYWRIEPGLALSHDRAGLDRALQLVMQLDLCDALADCVVTLHHARLLPEVRGPCCDRGADLGAGLAGFGLGGSLAFLAAAECRPDVVVAYDGSSVPDHLDLLDWISCPVLFHYGGADPLIPPDRVAVVEAAAADRDHVEIHVHEGEGRERDDRDRPTERAWSQTAAFLTRHLPVRRA